MKKRNRNNNLPLTRTHGMLHEKKDGRKTNQESSNDVLALRCI